MGCFLLVQETAHGPDILEVGLFNVNQPVGEHHDKEAMPMAEEVAEVTEVPPNSMPKELTRIKNQQ